jgi:hypothetical protein
MDMAASARRRLHRRRGQQLLQPVLIAGGARRGRRFVDLLKDLEAVIAIRATIIEKRHFIDLVTPESPVSFTCMRRLVLATAGFG